MMITLLAGVIVFVDTEIKKGSSALMTSSEPEVDCSLFALWLVVDDITTAAGTPAEMNIRIKSSNDAVPQTCKDLSNYDVRVHTQIESPWPSIEIN